MNKKIVDKKNLPKELTWLGIQIDKRQGTPLKDVFDKVQFKPTTSGYLKESAGETPFIGGGKVMGYTSTGQVVENVFTISRKGSAGVVNYFNKVVPVSSVYLFRTKEEYKHLNTVEFGKWLNEQLKPLQELAKHRSVVPGLTQGLILDYKVGLDNYE